MWSKTIGTAIWGALLGALPAHAADFAPPAGCEVFMTVQMHNCQVANHYRCAADPAGDQWAAYSDGNGLYYVSHIDGETRWLESLATETGEVELLDTAASGDLPSFSTLLSTGKDDYDFVTRSNFGESRRYRGTDRLTGKSIKIDDVLLETISFELREETGAGEPISNRSGTQYISRKERLFLSGPERFESADGEVATFDDSPARFDFPGDPGFSSQTPEYDCDMMMTGAPGAAQTLIRFTPNSRSFSKEALR
ncbi:hypothetical protein [Thioclava atlantica]|uniref:hypothetical protein n=1 Tax=Thioclava atlantica TaxID=1317124 RepID=UPI000B094221|nr:hypothetical protein [Thioclava atlantica]